MTEQGILALRSLNIVTHRLHKVKFRRARGMPAFISLSTKGQLREPA